MIEVKPWATLCPWANVFRRILLARKSLGLTGGGAGASTSWLRQAQPPRHRATAPPRRWLSLSKPSGAAQSFFAQLRFCASGASALLRFCASALLFLCASVPLRFCSSVPLFLCASALLRFCSSVPLRFCASVPLFLCASVPLFLCSSVPLFLCSSV
ncbi:MAG: hypothetical protein EI684_08545, partial [Candidatus Viridilinea halotolerans]